MIKKLIKLVNKKIRARQMDQQFKRDLIPLQQEIESKRWAAEISDPKAVAVLLSYKRPKNLPLISRTLLTLPFISKVIVSNNNPDLRMEDYFDFADDRLELINQKERRRAGFRFGIVKEMAAQNYIFIDDDLFLKPSQIVRLYKALLDNPAVAHGVWGQRFIHEKDQKMRMEIIRNFNGELDVINRAYFLTRQHVQRFFELLQAIGINDIIDLKFGDDMILSFSGTGRPRCHDMGPLLDCPSKDADDIAIWREGNFHNYRGELYSQLVKIRDSSAVSDTPYDET